MYWVQDMLAIMFRAEGVGGQVCLLKHVLFWLEGHDRTTKDGIAQQSEGHSLMSSGRRVPSHMSCKAP